ncbi:MAG: tRNA (N6-isopentenyl adenosine(37)-C2)-methylthiotransferase MiaB [Candidatus Omnitrophica bacterium]|nr:tRNA (N6-isopentenyl adenosine(37)-C2)-methylthiotransferase MiaB [Candidatus Omnitrophota bacterium]
MTNKRDTQKKVFLRTFGCQMNVRDAEVICGLLTKEGYQITDDPHEADILLFNTCSVRQHAEERVWSEIGRHQDNKIIGVLGCMAQEHKEAIFQRVPKVSFVVGPSDIAKIPEIIEKVTKSGLYSLKIWETDGQVRPEEIYHTGFYRDKNPAYVVISEGCSNFCSYCVVPYVRGPLRDRDSKDILREIEEAIAKGITRITLLGQNVNGYRCNDINFIKLIELVNSIKGLEEFSFVTSHPKDASRELFVAMAQADKLKKYLHLPVQSGSDRILKLMNRGYTRKYYLELADNYRKIVKGGALTTDIILGFPSEAEKDFQDTYDLVKEVVFDAAFIFKYSPRPDTGAAKLPDDVSREEKEKRHKLILDLQKGISKIKNGKKNNQFSAI